MKRCFIVIFLLTCHSCWAIDLCIILGNCGQTQNNNNPFVVRSDDSGPNAVQVDSDWIEAEGSTSNQVFHFAKNAGAMSWYEADAYCFDKGGFLAEPVSSAENDFLKGQARQHPNTNWWTGLRGSEDCKCSSNDARAAIQFEANIDYDTVTDSSGNGYIKTKCPSTGTWEKTCSHKVWRWSYSGVRMTFSDWNTASGEPNGGNEHCVPLWLSRGEYR
jgi:hypothetical protein